MMEGKSWMIGSLLILILVSGIVYISFDNVKIRVDNDKTTIYVKLLDDNGEPRGRWLVAGREYNSLFDGTTRLNRRTKNISVEAFAENNSITIIRTTPYIRGPIIIDTYFFSGDTHDVEMVPISHTIEILNGTGLFYKYEVKNLDYDGETFKLDGKQTSINFKKNIKVTWWKDYRLGWIYKSGSMYVKSEKIESDYQMFNVRLFDPILSTTNKKDYDNKTNTATIKDETDKVLGKFTRVTEQKVNVGIGERKVAEFKINNSNPKANIITKIEAFDVTDKGLIPRLVIFDYKFKNVTYYINKSNSSDIMHERIDWLDFDNSKQLPKGEVMIGLYTTVYPEDHVEWIPYFHDVAVPEWAEYENSLIDAHGCTLSSGGAQTRLLGIFFKAKANKTVISLQTDSDFTGDHCQIGQAIDCEPPPCFAQGTIVGPIANSTVISDIANFTAGSFNLTNQSCYVAICGNADLSTYNRGAATCGYPKIGTNVDFLSRIGNNGDEYDAYCDIGGTNNAYNWISITTADLIGPTPGGAELNATLNVGSLRYLNCSPDWEHYPANIEDQTDALSAINLTNNGTVSGNFLINVSDTPANGWTLFACNDSSADPNNDISCFNLTTANKNIWSDVIATGKRSVWLYANCSSVFSNPQVDINLGVENA